MILNEREKNYIKFWINYDVDYLTNEIKGCSEVLSRLNKETDSKEIENLEDLISEHKDKLDMINELKTKIESI